MFWVEALLSFALWIAYGVFQSRRSEQIRAKIAPLPRKTRIIGGAALMVLSLGFLVLALAALQSNGGLGQNGMTWWSWLLVSTMGIGFVHAQIMSMGMLITVAQDAVTEDARRASTTEGSHEERSV